MVETRWPLLRTEQFELTVEKAREHQAMQRLPKDRELSQRRIQEHKADFDAGNVVVFNWVIAELPDGSKVGLNGNTTSHMIANGVCAIPKGAVARWDYYSAKDLADAGDLWSRLDSRHSARSVYETAKAAASGDPELAELSADLLVKAGNAILSVDRKVYCANWSQQERDSIRPRLRPFAFWFHALPVPKGRLFNKMKQMLGLLTVCYKSWLLDPDLATEFWSQMIKETDTAGNPIHPGSGPAQLRKFVLDPPALSAPGGAKRVTGSTRWSVYASQAWNAWVEGRHRTLRATGCEHELLRPAEKASPSRRAASA